MIGPKIRHIAVIDIGKTNAKLALVDLAARAEIAVVTQPNTARAGPPYRHFDVNRHWTFLLDGLRTFDAAHGVDAISVTTHGACCALLDTEGGLAAPVLDYEDSGPDEVARAYDAIRPGFAETGSPRLPMGLNVGAQLFWMFGRDPGLLARTAAIVTYPQYWGHRLTGALATDVTSLGCHTDLWNPERGQFSSLVDRLGIRDRMAVARKSADILGPVLPAIAQATGLAPDTPVACGIHDSNASLYPYILARQAPFAVVSTGTWAVVMAVGGDDVALDPARDILINVNALGAPTRSARFMGGREFELLTKGGTVTPTTAEVAGVLADGPMLLPAVVQDSGPFQGRKARWVGQEPLPGTGAYAAAISFYLALMTAQCLTLTGARGPVIVEGAFARNSTYLAMLASAVGRAVSASASATGTSLGAALLFDGEDARPVGDAIPDVHADPAFQAYASRWVQAVAA